MNVKICFALLGLLALPGCSQLTTSKAEEASLQKAADDAGAGYLRCLDESASRYLSTGETAESISRVARKDCASPRETAAKAQAGLLETRYILADSEVTAALKALDDQGEAAIARRVLDYRAGAPAPAPARAPSPAPVVAAAPAASTAYLACMQAQGERYAGVNEPAEVVAEVAHSRCAANLSGAGSGGDIERQGRALVMGLVLDRKARKPQ
jgi:hypothetical protein